MPNIHLKSTAKFSETAPRLRDAFSGFILHRFRNGASLVLPVMVDVVVVEPPMGWMGWKPSHFG